MFDPFFQGIAWLLSAFYGLVPNYAFAIVMLTLTIYLFLFPVMLKQTRSMLAMARLQPEIAKLKKEHKGDSRALMEAQQAVFAREGINPAASCLPMLLQMPAFIILWQVLHGLVHKTEGVPDPKHLEEGSRLYRDIVAGDGELVSFGVDLAKTALQGPHASFFAALPFFALAVAAGVATYFQMMRSQGRNPQAGEGQPGMQMMTRIFPFLTVASSLFFPAGLALYFLIAALFRVGQQEAMYRWDPHVVKHAQAAAATIETTAMEVSKEKAQVEAPPDPKRDKKNKPGKGDRNGSDPPPAARESGRAQPKGTQGRRRKRKKSRR